MNKFEAKNNFIISLNGQKQDTANVTTQINFVKNNTAVANLSSVYDVDISSYDFDYCEIILKRKANNVSTNEQVQVLVSYDIATSYEPYIEPETFILNSNEVYEEFKKDEDTIEILNTTNAEYGINLRAYKNGKTITLFVYTNKTLKAIANGGLYLTLGTLPEEFRPPVGISQNCIASNKGVFTIQIDNNGIVQLGWFYDAVGVNSQLHDIITFTAI